MTDINQKLLNLIIEGYDLNKISQELGLTKKQILNRLEDIKNNGYNLAYDILDNGTRKYKLYDELVEPLTHTAKIKLVKERGKFTAMIISDLHIGSTKNNLNRLNLIYRYCKRNGINIIINCGDLIESTGTAEKCHLDTNRKQIEYLIKNHPYDESIINLVCFGNHDYLPLVMEGLDTSKLLCHERPDFISLGYDYGFINILNSQIIVRHKIKKLPFKKDTGALTGKIVLSGHSHKMGILTKNDHLAVHIPTLSDDIFNNKRTLPGACKLDIEFDEKGNLYKIHLEHLLITTGIYSLNNITHVFTSNSHPPIDESEIKRQITKKLT